jgi:hypothetical protein
MISAIFAAALLAQATPAASAPTPSTPVVAPAPPGGTTVPGVTVNVAKGPKVNKEGLICHSEPVLGSRIPKKVCSTPAEAADRAQQDQMMLNHMQGNMGGNIYH